MTRKISQMPPVETAVGDEVAQVLQDGINKQAIAVIRDPITLLIPITDARITQVETDSIQRDAVLQINIDNESSQRFETDNFLDQKIENEIIDRESADNNLQDNIDDEEAARIAADLILQDNIDDEEAARIAADLILQNNIDDEETDRIAGDAALEASKEDNVDFGTASQIAIVNASGDGFDFIDQPDFEFFRIRGYASSPVDEDSPVPIAGDALNIEIIAGTPPNDDAGNPSGITYIVTEPFTWVEEPGEPATDYEAGWFIFWSGDNDRFMHFERQVADNVSDINGLIGSVLVAGGDGINQVTGAQTITLSVDATVARDTDITILQGNIDAEALARGNEDIALGNRIDTNTGLIGDVASDLTDEIAARIANDGILQVNIDAEALARGNEDIALGIRIDDLDLGEANTSSNAGTGAGLALDKVGEDLPFKSILAGANVTIDEQANTITISSESGLLPADRIILDANEIIILTVATDIDTLIDDKYYAWAGVSMIGTDFQYGLLIVRYDGDQPIQILYGSIDGSELIQRTRRRTTGIWGAWSQTETITGSALKIENHRGENDNIAHPGIDTRLTTAQGDATQGITDALAAQTTADAAQGTADQAITNAAIAQSTAVAAQGTADQAITDALAAQTTANTADGKADALAISKEDSIAYGIASQIAVVNTAGDGFDFVDQPDFEFFRIRGYASSPLDEDSPVPIAGDALNIEIIAGTPPNDDAGNPSGITYIVTEPFTWVEEPGEPATDYEAGWFIFWSGDNDRFMHFERQVADNVSDINGLIGSVLIAGGTDITVVVGAQTITLNADVNLVRQAALNITNANVSANASAILLKADQTALDATDVIVGQNTNAIADKADQTALNATNVIVGQNTSAIGVNASAIALKADQTALNATNVIVGQNTSAIGVNTSAIADKADQTDLVATNVIVSQNTSAAAAALSAAVAAQVTANQAIIDAADALSAAVAAQGTANTALTNANAAQGTANTAITNAAAANTNANGRLPSGSASIGTTPPISGGLVFSGFKHTWVVGTATLNFITT